jgi:hypothetical protein
MQYLVVTDIAGGYPGCNGAINVSAGGPFLRANYGFQNPFNTDAIDANTESKNEEDSVRRRREMGESKAGRAR